MVSDYIMEGPSRALTATIITDTPQAIKEALMTQLGRGVSSWEVNGGYDNATHTVIMCTIPRRQLDGLKQIIAYIDPSAFVSIGVTQQAIGAGFTRAKL